MGTAKEDITIRAASVTDAEELLAIYAPYIEKTAVTYEYEVPTTEEFAARIGHTLEKYPYLVAEAGKEIVGYAYAGPLHERAAYDWSVELSIYVKRERKGQGVGRKLYESLEEILRKQGIVHAAACIAYPEQEDEYLNYDSVHFHEKLGFTMVGQFHACACKFDRWYGMVWMEKQIGEHREKPPAMIPFPKICYDEEVCRMNPKAVSKAVEPE